MKQTVHIRYKHYIQSLNDTDILQRDIYNLQVQVVTKKSIQISRKAFTTNIKHYSRLLMRLDLI